MDSKNNRILLIINPRSGKTKGNNLFSKIEKIVSDESGSPENLTTVFTEHRGHATEIAANSEKYNRVICMGGDGTLNEVCNGLLLIPKDQRPKLGYIPAGSTNDFARGIGLPKSLKKSAKLAVSDHCAPIDTGLFKNDAGEDRAFSYVASFGLFSKISYSTNQDIKNRFGHFAYLFEGLKNISDLQNCKPFKLKIRTEDTYIEQQYIFGAITNSTSLGGLVKFDKKNVRVNDGLFELVLIKKPTNIIALTDTLRQLFSHKYRYNRIVFTHAGRISLESEIPLEWTLDGEFAGTTQKVEITVSKSSIDFIRKEEVRAKPYIRKKLP